MLFAFQKVNALNSERSQLFDKVMLWKANALSFSKVNAFSLELTF